MKLLINTASFLNMDDKTQKATDKLQKKLAVASSIDKALQPFVLQQSVIDKSLSERDIEPEVTDFHISRDGNQGDVPSRFYLKYIKMRYVQSQRDLKRFINKERKHCLLSGYTTLIDCDYVVTKI